ncbi:GNAT family N-acetyltransferase [Massilia sp. TN1-12]|uniref:GNAT family N-acetyltransferase n=1 Tax=Massilia paldalensis TaxID=3377675 RepID=UPI00384C2448
MIAGQVRTRRATAADLEAVRALYAAGGYGGGVDVRGAVIVAVLDDAVVGAVRLCVEHGVRVLRGMQVGAGHRRRGIGRALLAACDEAVGDEVAYCLPYANLAAFYGRIGFRLAARDALPAFLQERLGGYAAAGQQVMAMVRAT